MTALAADRNTPSVEGVFREFSMLAAARIFAGSLVMIDSNGRAAPGSEATGRIAVGRAEENADNSTGANDALTVRVRAGIFRFANSAGGDLIERHDIGATVFIVDDQTVGLTDNASARSAAGRVWDVDADGVWVAVGLP